MTKLKKPWFRAKNFGYGWYPATWQGWLIIIIFAGAIIADAIRLNNTTDSVSDFIRPLVLQVIGMTALLILICILTGEKPEWRWGGKKLK